MGKIWHHYHDYEICSDNSRVSSNRNALEDRVYCLLLSVCTHWCNYYIAMLLLCLQGCDYVIALTHMRWPNDTRLAEEVDEIDLILGGHDHDYTVKQVCICLLGLFQKYLYGGGGGSSFNKNVCMVGPVIFWSSLQKRRKKGWWGVTKICPPPPYSYFWNSVVYRVV